MTTEHTDKAMKAGDRIIQQIFRWCYTEIEKKRDPALLKKLQNTLGDEIAAIIDQETVSPDLLNLFAERDRLREVCKELIKSIKEDWGISRRYRAIRNAEAVLAKEPESRETNQKGEIQ